MISIYKLFEVVDIPDVRQSTNYTCGPSVMLSILSSYEIESREDKLAKFMNTTKDGTEFSGFIKVAEKYKLKYKYDKFTIDDLKKFIDNKFPCIILIQGWADNKNVDYTKTYEDGHYAIPISYDKEKMYFEDPSVIGISFLTFKEVEERWHGLGENDAHIDNMGIVFLEKPKKERKNLVHMEGK